MANILITGGTGLIGTRLTELLLQRGHKVSHLGRSKENGTVESFVWDVHKRWIDPSAFEGIDAIVHLAGAGIGDKRWTAKRKDEILNSRVDSTRLLYDELNKRRHTVKTVVSAAGVAYYGLDNGGKFALEEDSPGTDYLANVAQRWEAEVDKLNALGLRIVKLRTSLVLSDKGGALKELERPIKLFVGAPLGTGRQYMSWIHIDDHCGIIIKSLEDVTIQGVYNSVAPNPVTNKQFTKEVASVLSRPILLPPIPGFVLKTILGEMADLVLFGNKISGEKIQRAGYTFKFTNLQNALRDLLKDPDN